ncbi:MAG: hypothetical protein JNJ58_03930 [Chitinophagaceae bacterium]|nr:hypothetical protein [Chitinophagaceae bacterium]
MAGPSDKGKKRSNIKSYIVPEITAMKINRYSIIFPFTILSMFFVTKWWFALPVDGPDKLYWGFPFAFMGEGFHTSMSFQFFMVEFLADFVIYLLVWTMLFLILFKRIPNFKLHPKLSKLIWSLSLVFLMGFGGYVSISNPVFHAKRNYNWKVLKTGYIFLWQTTPRPDILQYLTSNHSNFNTIHSRIK